MYAAIWSGCPTELVELLLGRGGDPDAAGPDGRSPYRLATALGRTDRTALLRRHGARGEATGTESFPADARGGDDGRTALHAAAYSGSASAARLLLDHGADTEARDTTWDSTPLVWAMVGSGERPRNNPRPDWAGCVRILLEAGASTEGITLSADDEKPPSPEVAEILRVAMTPGRGIAGR